jgi:hypothetical protein
MHSPATPVTSGANRQDRGAFCIAHAAASRPPAQQLSAQSPPCCLIMAKPSWMRSRWRSPPCRYFSLADGSRPLGRTRASRPSGQPAARSRAVRLSLWVRGHEERQSGPGCPSGDGASAWTRNYGHSVAVALATSAVAVPVTDVHDSPPNPTQRQPNPFRRCPTPNRSRSANSWVRETLRSSLPMGHQTSSRQDSDWSPLNPTRPARFGPRRHSSPTALNIYWSNTSVTQSSSSTSAPQPTFPPAARQPNGFLPPPPYLNHTCCGSTTAGPLPSRPRQRRDHADDYEFVRSEASTGLASPSTN